MPNRKQLRSFLIHCGDFKSVPPWTAAQVLTLSFRTVHLAAYTRFSCLAFAAALLHALLPIAIRRKPCTWCKPSYLHNDALGLLGMLKMITESKHCWRFWLRLSEYDKQYLRGKLVGVTFPPTVLIYLHLPHFPDFSIRAGTSDDVPRHFGENWRTMCDTCADGAAGGSAVGLPPGFCAEHAMPVPDVPRFQVHHLKHR